MLSMMGLPEEAGGKRNTCIGPAHNTYSGDTLWSTHASTLESDGVQRRVQRARLTWLEVPMVQTQSPALLPFQLRQQLPHDPRLVAGVVRDEGVVPLGLLLVFQLSVKEQSQEEVVGVDQLPPHEMVGEGRQHKEEDRARGGDKVDELCVHCAGLDVELQQFLTFKL